MARLVIDLKPSEKDALRQLARRELREPGAQAALLVRQGLLSAGVLREPSAANIDPAAHDRQPCEVRNGA